MINPSKPENQQWLRDGAEWLFSNLPDIGGINLENGDFMSCYCDECRVERARPENDPNCFWDMMTSQKPVLDVAKHRRPDGWMTFATYVGFTEATARNIGRNSVYPPKFVNQTPDNAICQWTITSMTTPATWPAEARPPAARFQDQIGLLHHGSLWGSPVDPARWWAAPGAWADEYSALLPFVCGRIAQAKLGGLVITGQNGNQFPAHELNYLALEYFSWHPERTYEQFQHDRLEPCYGGAERASLFLRLLRSTVKTPGDIEAARLQGAADGRRERPRHPPARSLDQSDCGTGSQKKGRRIAGEESRHTMSFHRIAAAAVTLLCIACPSEAADEETLLPLTSGRVPESVDEIRDGFDPRKEPLEAEILKEWEDDGVLCRIVRYRIGVFKGTKSMMAGIYAFPRGGKNLPGLIQVHGGGQSANLNAATTNARRGYACISLNWGGNRLNDGNYQKILETPGTDWGAVDGTHPPKRDPVNHFVSCAE